MQPSEQQSGAITRWLPTYRQYFAGFAMLALLYVVVPDSYTAIGATGNLAMGLLCVLMMGVCWEMAWRGELSDD